jgi:IS5 family transposase
MVRARTFPGNPYDGHLLSEHSEQTRALLEDAKVTPQEVIVDLGFRGVDADNSDVTIIHRDKYASMPSAQRRWLRRGLTVEPAIGHLKADRRIDRCLLKVELGDAMYAVLCAAGYNLRWMVRAILRKGIRRICLALVNAYHAHVVTLRFILISRTRLSVPAE